ncbi:MAG TPA: sigma-70 family RNA polymerase sigma factor [Polyangiaceae bacterium]|nr:sigma-70 family RNA polymerase sigma factor [Polyangiaceae bacterium]
MIPSRRRADSPPPKSGEGRVLRLPLPESDAALVAAARAGRADGREELVRRCTPDVERILYRVLGPDSEIEDVIHDVFMAAFLSLEQLREPEALRSWLVGIAIRKARKLIARRKRWSFIRSVAPNELPDRATHAGSADVTEALRATYRVLADLPVDDRIAFALRRVDGMELTAVADAMDVSLATVKRRLSRASERFVRLARKHEVLTPWLTEDQEP